jgi:hypothetical protein
VLEEDTILFSSTVLAGGPPAGIMANLIGGFDSVAVCGLGQGPDGTIATAAGTCSSVAHKYNTGTISGTVRTPGTGPGLPPCPAPPAGPGFPCGANADGIMVRIQPGPRNVIDFDPTDPIRARTDTTVRVTGGTYAVGGLTEGQWIVTVLDTINPTTGDTIFGVTGQRVDTVDLQVMPPGSTDIDIVNFVAFSGNNTIAGVVVNDRDADLTTLDPGEALAGVTIQLYRNNTAAGITIPADSLVATTTTNSSGAYTFGRLREGRYIIRAMNPGPGGELVLESFNADGSPDTLQVVTINTTPASGSNITVGSTTPVPLPRWDYDASTGLNTAPTNFTFLYRNTTARATVTTAAGVPVSGMLVTIRRCNVSAGSTSPPSGPSVCTSYQTSFAPITMATNALGVVDFTNLLEGVYEVRPQPTTAAFSSTAPSSALYRLVGAGDVEAFTFTAVP